MRNAIGFFFRWIWMRMKSWACECVCVCAGTRKNQMKSKRGIRTGEICTNRKIYLPPKWPARLFDSFQLPFHFIVIVSLGSVVTRDVIIIAGDESCLNILNGAHLHSPAHDVDNNNYVCCVLRCNVEIGSNELDKRFRFAEEMGCSLRASVSRKLSASNPHGLVWS